MSPLPPPPAQVIATACPDAADDMVETRVERPASRARGCRITLPLIGRRGVSTVGPEGVSRGSSPRSHLDGGGCRARLHWTRSKAPDYYDIAIVPATEVAEDDQIVIGGTPFLAPTGDAFDVDLIRDLLNRAEESVVSTGPSPALLLVTSGVVFVESSSGLVEMTSGDAAQVAGDVVITGASREPAAFVLQASDPNFSTGPCRSFPISRDPAPIATPAAPWRARRWDLGVALPMAYSGGMKSGTAPFPRAELVQFLMSDDRQPITALGTKTAMSLHRNRTGPLHLRLERPRISQTRASAVAIAPATCLGHAHGMNRCHAAAAGDEVACTWYPVQLIPGRNADRRTAPPATTTAQRRSIPTGTGVPMRWRRRLYRSIAI